MARFLTRRRYPLSSGITTRKSSRIETKVTYLRVCRCRLHLTIRSKSGCSCPKWHLSGRLSSCHPLDLEQARPPYSLEQRRNPTLSRTLTPGPGQECNGLVRRFRISILQIEYHERAGFKFTVGRRFRRKRLPENLVGREDTFGSSAFRRKSCPVARIAVELPHKFDTLHDVMNRDPDRMHRRQVASDHS